MLLRNTRLQYGAVAKLLHWVMVVLLVGMVGVGLYMEDLSIPEKLPGTTGYALYQLHKSFGFVVLALAVVRLVWRLANPAPPAPTSHGRLVAWGAHASHTLLYVLIFAMPISGWLYVSADPLSHSLVPTRFFDLFVIPNLLGADEGLRNFFRGAHGLLSNVLMITVGLHAAAAIGHHFVFRDNVLLRMLPFARLRPEAHAGTATRDIS
ncbi:MAG: cytochrome b [Alphaproteobacteria bacterium]